ncbi:hypothetical protein PR048_021942 [Dryococelus australis]|uniref:Uncharacterized protein n=1 Tax=Dryococelus australis TaxID=614101 RepID=A0ABQ9GZM6_9NEOP|nr:hypothetical protein PR048_021942 [Dryococelus australis]
MCPSARFVVVCSIMHSRPRAHYSGYHWLLTKAPVAAMCYEWHATIFSFESNFCLHHHGGRIHVWRHRGARLAESCTMHCHGPVPAIMVWGSIGFQFRSCLVPIAGTLTCNRYIAEELEPVVVSLIFRTSLRGLVPTGQRATGWGTHRPMVYKLSQDHRRGGGELTRIITTPHPSVTTLAACNYFIRIAAAYLAAFLLTGRTTALIGWRWWYAPTPVRFFLIFGSPPRVRIPLRGRVKDRCVGAGAERNELSVVIMHGHCLCTSSNTRQLLIGLQHLESKIKSYTVHSDFLPPSKANRVRFLAGSPGFSRVGNVADVAVRRRVFSGNSSFFHPYIPPLLYLHLTAPSPLARRVGRKAVQCWDTELGCAHQARSVYLLFCLWVQLFYSGTKIKLDPGSELGSFDLGSGKMLNNGATLPHVLGRTRNCSLQYASGDPKARLGRLGPTLAFRDATTRSFGIHEVPWSCDGAPGEEKLLAGWLCSLTREGGVSASIRNAAGVVDVLAARRLTKCNGGCGAAVAASTATQVCLLAPASVAGSIRGQGRGLLVPPSRPPCAACFVVQLVRGFDLATVNVYLCCHFGRDSVNSHHCGRAPVRSQAPTGGDFSDRGSNAENVSCCRGCFSRATSFFFPVFIPLLLLILSVATAVSLLASYQGEPGSIPVRVTPNLQSGNRDGRCRWSTGFFGDLPFPPAPSFRRLALIDSQDLDPTPHVPLPRTYPDVRLAAAYGLSPRFGEGTMSGETGRGKRDCCSPNIAQRRRPLKRTFEPIRRGLTELGTFKSATGDNKDTAYENEDVRTEAFDGKAARFARRSDEALEVRVSVARIFNSIFNNMPAFTAKNSTGN